MEQVETTTYSLAGAPPAPIERRDGDRLVTLFRVGSLLVGGSRELCLIKNMSAGGMLIRAYSPVVEGARLSVELKCGQPVAGIARWVDGQNVGIEFDSPIDVAGILSQSLKGPRPRMPRVEVGCVASVRQGAEFRRVRLLDISQGGIKVASDEPLEEGAPVTVTLPGLQPRHGVVVWHRADCFGIGFNELLSLGILVSWLQHQQTRLRSVS